MDLKELEGFFVIAGNIGAGKSTLARLLAERLNYEPYFERVQGNPYLDDFYRDMKRWGFPLQIYFLSHRFEMHQVIQRQKRGAIQDRSIYEDIHVFSKNLLQSGLFEARDYETYQQLAQALLATLRPPQLLIYLQKSVGTLQKKIQERGRSFEQAMPVTYLESLDQLYQDWVTQYPGRKLVVASDHLDFLHEPKHLEGLLEQIAAALKR